MDTVVAFNVVLPNGTPVTATKDEFTDLFWALKVSSLCAAIETESLF